MNFFLFIYFDILVVVIVMKKPELLAPVGNFECLKAAIAAGSDAVYLGGYTFGARNFAGNFSNEEIIEAINLCHLYGIKVYVTVNTLIYDNEVEMFLNYIEFLHKNNVDAVIMQDLGMIDLVRKTYPNLEIHASTQLHIHNIEGVKFVKSLGIKRVVVARETSIDIIKEIKKEVDMEIEAFVHGALCVSYSGQCLISSLIGGRSGNRGTCAQICRKKFTLLDENKKELKNAYLLSMKDLMTLEHIDKLIESGIDSLKIEGRMKRPEYVYLMIKMYRKAIDSYLELGYIDINKKDIYEIMKLFNREFTKGYILNDSHLNVSNDYRPNHMGINIGRVIEYKNNKVKIKLNDTLRNGDGIRILSKEDIGLTISFMYKNGKLVTEANKGDFIELSVKGQCKINDEVRKTTDFLQLKNINNEINDIKRKVPINIILKALLNQNIELFVSDGINNLKVANNILVSKAVNYPITKDKIEKQISKLGDTVYEIDNIEIECDDNIFINIKDINELRRIMVDKLNNLRLKKKEFIKNKYQCEVPYFEKTKNINILISNYNDLKKVDKYDLVIADNMECYNKVEFKNKILKLPRVIEKYLDYNNRLLVGEVGSLYKYNNIDTDFSLNVTNSYTVAFLHSLGVNKITLSYELNYEQIKRLIEDYYNRYNKYPNLEIIVDGYEEVMITKLNLLFKFNISKGYLKDEFGNLYKLVLENDLMKIYNYKKRNIQNYEDYFKLGVNNIRINLDNRK